MIMESIGKQLRRERELRHVSLEELAQTTRIPLRNLLLIEDDRFDELPGDVFTRGFLRAYAKAVGANDDAIVTRYASLRTVSVLPTPITALTAPERSRRVGVAFAMVMLLVLFTLALSVVLRPRHRDVPVELSLAPGIPSALAIDGARTRT